MEYGRGEMRSLSMESRGETVKSKRELGGKRSGKRKEKGGGGRGIGGGREEGREGERGDGRRGEGVWCGSQHWLVATPCFWPQLSAVPFSGQRFETSAASTFSSAVLVRPTAAA